MDIYEILKTAQKENCVVRFATGTDGKTYVYINYQDFSVDESFDSLEGARNAVKNVSDEYGIKVNMEA